jgi:hypothetical protein
MRPNRIDIVTRGRHLVERNRRQYAHRPVGRRSSLSRLVRELRAGAVRPPHTDDN